MRRLLRYLLPIAAIAALIVLRPRLFPEKPLELKVFRAARGEVRETVTSPSAGTVTSRHEALVASEASGRVVAVKLREGDRVARGEPVVLLDASDADVELRAAQAARERQAAALEQSRLRSVKAAKDAELALGEKSVFSNEQIRGYESARDLAEAEVRWAERMLAESVIAIDRASVALGKRTIRAPFDGVIRKRRVEAGELVMPAAPVFEIYDDLHVYVKAPIDEVDLPRIELGRQVEVSFESFPDRLFHGTVTEIDPGVVTTQDVNRTGEVEVDLSDAPAPQKDGAYPPGVAPIRVGMSADVEIIARKKPAALRIPAYTVHEDDQGHFVYTVEQGRVTRRPIKIGYANWDYAEVMDGLSEGLAVVVSLDVEGLRAGAPAAIKGEVTKVQQQ